MVASGLLSDALTALLRSWRRVVANRSARRPAAAADAAERRPRTLRRRAWAAGLEVGWRVGGANACPARWSVQHGLLYLGYECDPVLDF